MTAFRLGGRDTEGFRFRRLATPFLGLYWLCIATFRSRERDTAVFGFCSLRGAIFGLRGLGMVFGSGDQRRFGRNMAQREHRNDRGNTDRSDTTETAHPTSSSR